MTTLSVLEFCSLFSYCPRSTSQQGELAKKIMRAIKNEQAVMFRSERLFASEFVAKILKIAIDKGFFTEFFDDDVCLIPVPRSSPTRKDSLWPSFQIAKAMEREGLGTVKPILKRIKPVPRSSLVPPELRPSPTEHYNSMKMEKFRLNSKKLLLVDDIVTRGHTLLGAAWRLKEVYQDADVKAFAAIRTVSNESEFKGLFDPVKGQIMYRQSYDDCLRRP